jgi:hypothetical protein
LLFAQLLHAFESRDHWVCPHVKGRKTGRQLAAPQKRLLTSQFICAAQFRVNENVAAQKLEKKIGAGLTAE